MGDLGGDAVANRSEGESRGVSTRNLIRAVLIGLALWLAVQLGASILSLLLLAIGLAVLAFVLIALVGLPGMLLFGIGKLFGLVGNESDKTVGRDGRVIEGEVIEPVSESDSDAEWREAGGTATPPPPPEPAPVSYSKRLRNLIDQHRSRLSEPVVTRLDYILTLVDELEGLLEDIEKGSSQRHTIEQTVESYVPDLLDRYVRLPHEFATHHLLPSGQTPRDLVIEQLDLLTGELKGLRGAAYERRTDDLIAHGEFLKARFERPAPQFDLQ